MEDKKALEKQALELKLKGVETEEIEKTLGHEFIFFQDVFGRQYISATLWK